MALCSTGLCPLNHGPRWHYMNYRTESSYNNLHPQKFQNFILCIFDRAFLYNPFQMKPITCTLLLSIFISTSLRVSGNYVPIIRRTYCIYATLVFVTLYGWVAGLQTRQPPIQIDTVSSPDDVHIVARNTYRSLNKYTKK